MKTPILFLSAFVLFFSISSFAQEPSKADIEAQLNQLHQEIQKVVEESKRFYEMGDTEKALKSLKEGAQPKVQKTSKIMEKLINNDELNDFADWESGKKLQDIIDEIKELKEKYSEKKQQELVSKWETAFIRESLHIIHTNLRLAVFISDYYIACLRKDKQWFKQNSDFLYSEMFCKTHISSWRKQIKEKYSLMRTYLIIVHFRGLGKARFSKNQFPTHPTRPPKTGLTDTERKSLKISEELKQNRARFTYEQNKHLPQHIISGLVKLPPVSIKEVILAEQIFDKNKFARKILSETGQLPENFKNDPQVVCANPSPTLIVNEFLNCFSEKYKELLVGNKNTRTPGLPILGFITSKNPSDEQLAEAISKIRENSLELLDEFKQEYFTRNSEGEYRLKEKECCWAPKFLSYLFPGNDSFLQEKDFSIDENIDIFQFLSNRLETDSDGYKKLKKAGVANDEVMELISVGHQKYEDKITNRMWFEIGLMIVWGVGCPIIFKTPLARGFCELPVGLVANIYFFIIDTHLYEEALKVALYRPDDSRPSYQEISELDDLAIARFFSTALLPFFTGIPLIIKALVK